MWSNVITPQSLDFSPDSDSTGSPTPPTRYKHSCTLHYSPETGEYLVYVFGGRSGTFALKDFWELNIQTGVWREIKQHSGIQWPPRLQEHTLVSSNNRLYVFGGECHHNSDTNSHLWVWQREDKGWEKISFKQEGGRGQLIAPVMRRGHTAVVCEVDDRECIVIYGGYRDLKGSLGDCWGYFPATNTWTMLSSPPTTAKQSFWTNILSYWTTSSPSYTNLIQQNGGYYKCTPSEPSGPCPSARHNHSAVFYNSRMYVYGGMCDLVELSDFWYFDIEGRKWSQIKYLSGPGVLKGHAAVVVGGYMYFFGGETKGGIRVDDVWKFDFRAETFERLQFPGCHPCPRVFASATKLPIRRKQTPSLTPTSSAPPPPATRPSSFRKSTSVVRFADTQQLVTYSDYASPHTPSCSDYSSMETINYVENPNYKHESFEMKNLSEQQAPRYSVQHPEYILVIGGLETHSSVVFNKRDLVVWRLRVDCRCNGDERERNFDRTEREEGERVLSRERSFEVEF